MVWRRYVPSAVAVGLAIFFLRNPGIAALILVLLCLGFAVLHAVCVSQLIQAELEASRRNPTAPAPDPKFREVAVAMAKKTGLLKGE